MYICILYILIYLQNICLNSKLPQAIKKVLFNHTEQLSDIAPRYTYFAPGLGGRGVWPTRRVKVKVFVAGNVY